MHGSESLSREVFRSVTFVLFLKCILNQFRSAPCKVLQIFDKHVPMFCAWCASCLASCYKASHSKGRLNHPPPQYSAGTCSDSSPYHGDEKHSVQLLLSHSRIIVDHVQICVNVHSQFMWNHCQFQTWKRWKHNKHVHKTSMAKPQSPPPIWPPALVLVPPFPFSRPSAALLRRRSWQSWLAAVLRELLLWKNSCHSGRKRTTLRDWNLSTIDIHVYIDGCKMM